MSVYSQSELLRRSAIFTANGPKAEAQAIIAGVGYNPAELSAGADKITAVQEADAIKTELDASKRKTTHTEKLARQAAQKELTSLSETARTLFANDLPTLILLDLQTRYETKTDPETGESKRVAVQASKATANVLAHWHIVLAGTGKLAEAEQLALTTAGWPPVRVANAQTLVEAFGNADIAQQAGIQAAQAASQTYKTAVKALEAWYIKARRLCRIAIKDADPTNSQNLIELLGIY